MSDATPPTEISPPISIMSINKATEKSVISIFTTIFPRKTRMSVQTVIKMTASASNIDGDGRNDINGAANTARISPTSGLV